MCVVFFFNEIAPPGSYTYCRPCSHLDALAIYPEQRGMTMQLRQLQTLHVVERQRRMDQEAEQAGADQIPKCNRDEEHHRPAIALHPWRRPAETVVVEIGRAHV